MNERIRELATEVGISVDYLTNTKQIVLLEKFAELIVGECCGAADDWYQKHSELHWDPAQHIRNHFGVEQ